MLNPIRIVRPGFGYETINGKDQPVYFCQDCNFSSPDIFMVKDSLWEEMVPQNGVVCWACFEKRLGRHLTFEDLKPNTRANQIAISILSR